MDPLKTFRLESGKDFAQQGREVAMAALQKLGVALYQEGVGILEASKGLVPVDTGALRSSGYTAEPVYDGMTVTVDMGYGGPAAQINPKTGESTDGYALIVHENLDAFHKVGTAKFLEMPFDQATEGMAQRLATKMRDMGGMSGTSYTGTDTAVDEGEVGEG